ncbi:NAD(P)-dependent oxidoreductase [Novosphingobium profundi]|uniref:NAD-dependent epimerase/dehydratase family protein n=1 Tax=Novosphingobium profundi TaxID=1774954 RepID=UPI001BDAAD86|nr:NAD(P)-dependent oxidoreductase [Novosphingobium profundi]
MPFSVSLVTGAAGFIGAHLVHQLVRQGKQVHVIVRPSTRLDRLFPVLQEITVHRLDLADATALEACLAQVSPGHVYHLAADTRPRATSLFTAVCGATQANLSATLTLVEALAALHRPPRVLVRAATLAEYGPTGTASHEETLPRPETAYGAGMLATTAALGVLAPSLPFPVISARLALCYGPDQSPSFLVAEAIHALLEGRAVTLAHPDDRRDLMHVEDAVAGLLRIAQVIPADSPVLNIGTGHAPRMEDVLEMIRILVGLPPDFVRRAASVVPRRASELQMNPRLAWRRLGWRAAIGLEEGLARTLAAERRAREVALAAALRMEARA